MALVTPMAGAPPALLLCLAVVALALAATSAKAQAAPAPTPSSPTPAPTPAPAPPSVSLCPAGFSNLSEYKAAVPEYLKHCVALTLFSGARTITTRKLSSVLGPIRIPPPTPPSVVATSKGLVVVHSIIHKCACYLATKSTLLESSTGPIVCKPAGQGFA